MEELLTVSKRAVNGTLQHRNEAGSFAGDLAAFPRHCVTLKLSLSTGHQSPKHAFRFFCSFFPFFGVVSGAGAALHCVLGREVCDPRLLR